MEKRKNFMNAQLQPPSMYERSRAKIEKLNEEGRLARERAKSHLNLPTWAVKHEKPFSLRPKTLRTLSEERALSALNLRQNN